jgi:hypothetical protein
MQRTTLKALSPHRRKVVMRSDIVPGAVFPDYELSDHRGTRRTLSELPQGDPLVLVLSRGGFCPKKGGNTRDFCNSIARCKWATAVW